MNTCNDTASFISLLNIFNAMPKPSPNEEDDDLQSPLSAMDQAQIVDKIDDFFQESKDGSEYQQQLANMLETNIVEQRQFRSTVFRSQISLYGPLSIGGTRYKGFSQEEWKEQWAYVETFVTGLRSYLNEKYENEGFEIIVFSDVFTDDLFQKILNEDLYYNAYSLLFLLLMYSTHLRSLFLATVLLILILFSYPVTAFITKGIFGVTYFNQLQVMVMFVVISVATTCSYSFIDAWRQSSVVDANILPPEDKKRRIAYAYRRMLYSSTITSLTTASTMIPNIFSIIMPLKSFGIFAIIIVLVVYVEVLLVIPPAVLLYEQRMEQIVPILKKVLQKLKDKMMKQNREGMLVELPRPEIKTEIIVQDFFE